MANPNTLSIELATQQLPMVLIAKEDKKALGEMLMRLIKEMCVLSGTTTLDADTISIFAEQIIINFPQYRFEEIVLAFRQGINGRYKQDGQQSLVFGVLKYHDLTNWLIEYDNERAQYFIDLRMKESGREKSNAKEVFGAFSQEQLATLAMMSKKADAITPPPAYAGERLRRSWDAEDEKMCAIFTRSCSLLTDDEISDWLYQADAGAYTKTKQLILTEIERRKNTTKK